MPTTAPDAAAPGAAALSDIATPRLRLRPLAVGDAAALAVLLSDPAVAEWTERIPHPYGPSDAESFIAQAHADEAAGRAVVRAVVPAGGGEPMGTVAATVDPDGSGAELGWWIGVPHQRQGVATEAVGAVVDALFARPEIVALRAAAFAGNAASESVQRKLGFVPIGSEERAVPLRGGTRRLTLRVLTRRDWARSKRKIVLVAACALIDADGRVLLAQRPEGKSMAGLWEFPGGKVEPGETPESALIRELREELAVDTEESCLAPIAFASHGYETFHLLMPLFVCRVWQGRAVGREGQALAWVAPNRLRDRPMPEADIPLVAQLRDLL